MDDGHDVLSPLLFPATDGATGEIFELVATERFARRATRALRSFVERGLLDPGEARRIESEFEATPLPCRLAWHYSAGLFDDPQLLAVSPERCLDQLMLSLAAAGVPLRHHFLAEDTPLYTADGWRIAAGAAQGVVRNGAGPLFLRPGGAVDVRELEGAEALPALDSGGRRIALMTADHSDVFFDRHIDFALMPTESLPGQRIEEALADIERLMPAYYDWCTRAISSLILLDPAVSSMSSGSQGSCPGMVYLSSTLDPVKTAEMLIHEASHQYFRAIEALGRLTVGPVAEEFYSPVVGRNRPVAKLLLAYHAFANVLVYMAAIRPEKRSSERVFVDRNIEAIAADLASLADGLEAATTLSENGKTIWAVMRATARDVLTR